MEVTITNEDVEQYFERGFLGPIKLYDPDEMEDLREHVVSDVLPNEGPRSANDVSDTLVQDHPAGARALDRHLDCKRLADLCLHPILEEVLSSLYSGEFLTYFSQFFDKQPGGKEVGWHQDHGFFGLRPDLCPSFWVAFNEAHSDNGCLEFLPGSNEGLMHHEDTNREENWFDIEADPEEVKDYIRTNDLEPVEMELEPGECVIFSNATLHRSDRNTSSDRRLALLIRMIRPYAQVSRPQRTDPDVLAFNGPNYPNFHSDVSPPEKCQH